MFKQVPQKYTDANERKESEIWKDQLFYQVCSAQHIYSFRNGIAL